MGVAFVVLAAHTDMETLPVGAIVDVRNASNSVADRNVAARAVNGTYRTAGHLQDLRTRLRDQARAELMVAGHVRRLEALRRAGIVERVTEGVWHVRNDLIAKGQAYDRTRLGTVSVELKCHLAIERQVRAIGATWLDQKLLEGGQAWVAGFGAAAREAIAQRVDHLVERGLAERRDEKVFFSPNLLSTLRDREVAAAAQKIAQETGLR